MNAVTQISGGNVEAYRASTDAASLCKEIVVATASNIQGRKFVSVEGWQAIAIAHGCTAGARDVEKVDGGVRAIGEIRRMSDGAVLSTAEGFVGEDEPTWYGGNSRGKTLPKRADYAIRAMAQTRAISRACRSAFAHVVVMMNAGLSTTPAEEVPDGGFDDRPAQAQQKPAPRTVENDPQVALITKEQLAEIQKLATAKGLSSQAICTVGGIDSIAQMRADQFNRCKAWIAKQPAPNPQSSDILADEIPY